MRKGNRRTCGHLFWNLQYRVDAYVVLVNETRKDVSSELEALSTGLKLNIQNIDLDVVKEDKVTNEMKIEEVPKRILEIKDIRDNLGYHQK